MRNIIFIEIQNKLSVSGASRIGTLEWVYTCWRTLVSASTGDLSQFSQLLLFWSNFIHLQPIISTTITDIKEYSM